MLTYQTECYRTIEDALASERPVPLVVVQTDVGQVVGMHDAIWPDKKPVKLAIVKLERSGLFVKDRLHPYTLWDENHKSIPVLGPTFTDAISRTKASMQSMTVKYLVTKFEDVDNFETQTPAMICGRVRDEEKLCITGNTVGKLTFQVDEWIEKWQRRYDDSVSVRELARMAVYCTFSAAMFGGA